MAKPCLLVAVVLTMAASSCDRGTSGAEQSATPPPRPPVEVVETGAVADFSIRPAAPDTEISTVGTPAVAAGRGSVAIFAVERPPDPARCIVEARLRLFLERSSGPVEEELALYPSRVFDAAVKRDGDRFGYSGSLLDVRPRATYEGAGEGWSEWDVTAIVKRWTGGVFPSLGRRPPRRGPIVLALRDEEGAGPFARVRVASEDAPENAPHLEVGTRGGCS